MADIPVLSNIKNLLTAPAFPRTAISIEEGRLALVSLKRRKGEFEPVHLSSLDLPSGVVTSSFSEPNLVDEAALLETLEQLVVDSGLKRLRRLAVAIPDTSARSHVISLDGTAPGGL